MIIFDIRGNSEIKGLHDIDCCCLCNCCVDFCHLLIENFCSCCTCCFDLTEVPRLDVNNTVLEDISKTC